MLSYFWVLLRRRADLSIPMSSRDGPGLFSTFIIDFWVLFSLKCLTFVWLCSRVLFVGVPKPKIVSQLHIYTLSLAIFASILNWFEIWAVSEVQGG